MPDLSDLVDRFRAAHFAQILKEDRNRLHPMTVAVNHWMLQAVMDLFSSIFHDHCSYSGFTSLLSLSRRIVNLHLGQY
jgi:hypothetical protein